MFNVNCYANITVQEICTVFIDIRVLPLNGPKKPWDITLSLTIQYILQYITTTYTTCTSIFYWFHHEIYCNMKIYLTTCTVLQRTSNNFELPYIHMYISNIFAFPEKNTNLPYCNVHMSQFKVFNAVKNVGAITHNFLKLTTNKFEILLYTKNKSLKSLSNTKNTVAQSFMVLIFVCIIS